MSEAQAVEPEVAEDPTATARRMGWKPQEEYKGPPDKWKPAEAFISDLENPAILRDRYRTLDGRYGRLENVVGEVRTKLDEAHATILTLTNMTRTAEERAYKRARAELVAEREKAVEAGDTAAFRQADARMEELDKTKPVPEAPRPMPVPGASVAQDPAVQEFYRRNPWYNSDPILTKEADILHVGLVNGRPQMGLAENLAEVERRLKVLFPERFGVAAPQRTPVADDPRDEPGAVTPSSGSGSPRRQANRRSFDTIPQESKDAYKRYAAQLKGKGDPLTEKEWAEDYWSQFEDDGR